MEASAYGTAPIYLTATEQILHGSWWFPDLAPHLSANQLCDRGVDRLLSRRQPYTSATPFTGVWQLTERAHATFSSAGLRINYPEPASHVLHARDVAPGVDVVEAFECLLTESIATRLPHDGIGMELSGGIDSANVALSLREVHDGPIVSAGLIVDDGELGHLQQQRRTEVAARCQLQDEPIRAAAFPPLAPGGIRVSGRPHDVGEFYREGFAALGRHFAKHGIQVGLTGVGGDELSALRPAEATSQPPPLEPVPWLTGRARDAAEGTDTAPHPVLPTSVLTGSAVHNPDYLAAGLWPLSPLAAPALVRFAEQLPVRWRRSKRFLRQRLARAGLPRSVTHPDRTETFLGVMHLGLRHHGIPLARRLLRDGMLLVDNGFVNPPALAAALDEAEASDRVPGVLCDTLITEMSLRSLLGCPAPMPILEPR
ncbi:asparagine synthase-related protein [Saccharopolyspora elongata]|uniref:Asparagine synthase n=1 Tax=Saccharopolyspora elongata TaxID=2530387 RepID=A0A4R4Y9B5_9PSEU|nr:asparagine synthase C-terminal domain-containing protein [Saccharopolyspora elongata]TDD40309.1 asparagine synthase [Saccharopolyspora elongata]